MIPCCLFLLFTASRLEPQETWKVPLAELGVFPADSYATNLLAFADDGALLIMDQASRQLVFADAEGALIRRVGRSGRGPGEFTMIAAVGWSLMGYFTVMDRVNARVSTYDRQGRLLKEYSVREACREPVFGPDGQLFCLQRQGKNGFELAILNYHWKRETSHELFRQQMDPIATWMHWNPRIVLAPAPGGNWLAINNGKDAELRRIDSKNGEVLTSWKLRVPRIPLTEEFLASYKEEFFRRTGASDKGGAGPRVQFVTDDHWPWADHILVDEAERMWVFLHRASNQAPTRFFVYDKMGTPICEGALTGKVQAIRKGMLFAIQRDALGDDHLSKYQYRIP